MVHVVTYLVILAAGAAAGWYFGTRHGERRATRTLGRIKAHSERQAIESWRKRS